MLLSCAASNVQAMRRKEGLAKKMHNKPGGQKKTVIVTPAEI